MFDCFAQQTFALKDPVSNILLFFNHTLIIQLNYNIKIIHPPVHCLSSDLNSMEFPF